MAKIKTKLVLDNTQFNKATKTSKKLMNGLGSGLSAVGSSAKIASVAILAMATALTAAVAVSTRYIDRLGKVSKTTGFAVETLQKFQFAAEQSGVTSDNAALALRRFSRRLGEAQRATGELYPALKKLGIDTRDAQGRFKSAETILFEFAEGISHARNESEQLALAFKAFDSEGAELVETMKDGADGLRAFFNEAEDLGFILSTSAVQGVEMFADEFNRLQKVVYGLINQFTAALAPALQDVTEKFRAFISKQIDIQGGLEEFGKYLKDEFIRILELVVRALETTINAFIRFVNMLASILNKIGKMPLINLDIFPEIDIPLPEGRTGELIKALQDELKLLDTVATRPIPLRFVPGMLEHLEELGVETGELWKELKRLVEMPTLSKFNPFGDFASSSRGLVKELDTIISALTTKPLFESVDFSSFIEMLLGNLEENKAKAKEQVDAIEEIVVTGQSKVGETLLGKIFGVGPVTTFWREWYNVGEDSLKRFSAVASLVLGPELVDKIKDAFANSDIGDFTKTLADGLLKGVQMFEDSLADAIVNGKADFSDLADHLRQVLAKAMVQKFITGPIMALFGLASGGPAKAGQPYIVGEQGPELFIPKSSGTVVPNDALGMAGGPGFGSGGHITYNISAVDARSFKQLVSADPEYIYNVTQVGARRQPR